MSNVIHISPNAGTIMQAVSTAVNESNPIAIADSALAPIMEQVSETGLFTSTSNIDTHKAIVNHRGEPIAVVGSGYKVVQNREVFTSFNNMLLRSGLDLDGLKVNVKTSHGGARSFVRYELPAYGVDVTGRDRQVGDLINLQFLVVNSYDGSTSFSANLQGMRLACLNGMVLGQNISCYKAKHTKSLDVDKASEKLRIAADAFANIGEEWKRMYDTEISPETAQRAITKLAAGAEKVQQFLENQFQREVRELGHTEWALFNAMTHWSTHAPVRGSNGAATVLVREAKVNAVVSKFLLHAA